MKLRRRIYLIEMMCLEQERQLLFISALFMKLHRRVYPIETVCALVIELSTPAKIGSRQ